MLNVKIKDNGNSVKITNFPGSAFRRDLYKRYKSMRVSNFFMSLFFKFFGIETIVVHKSFLPELFYVLGQLPERARYKKVQNAIMEQSWMVSINEQHPRLVNTSKFSDFHYNLKPYQLKFIEKYEELKQKYRLNGYVLAFEQGLGKTFTSLALMHGLKKDAVIIVAPKSTLKTVWKNEINTIFKQKRDVWVIGEKPKKASYYIVNYESIEKLSTIIPFVIKSKNVGIIVDESHNFRNVKAQRVIRLQAIAKITKCQDILLMSGTPIKALGGEMIPTMQLLDPFFDDVATKTFKSAFGVGVPVALDILKNRLGFMMHRKVKEEVLDLPKKFRETVKIKIPNGKEYTLSKVKEQVEKFVTERQKFYKENKNVYEKEFEEVIDFLKDKLKKDKTFLLYLNTINYLRKHGYNRKFDKDFVKNVAKANEYEKEILRPMLPADLKRKFDRSKAVVKYLNLKIMGEVIGGFLNKLRAEMFSKMIENSPICKIIEESQKKTVCFSTFTDVVKSANEYLRSSCKYKPILVFGETSSGITTMLKDFKEDTSVNPLVATVQTLSTGVTLVEANTIIFLNKPWRHADASQAEDRVHRIGQDTDVTIYTFILDTGSDPNLSTRMEEIVAWSQKMFESIVGDDQEVKKTTQRFMKNFK